MLKIFHGRENLNKEKFLFDQIGKRALLLVPDQFTLEAEQALFRHTGAKALIDVEVLSMSRLGNRLLTELGGSKRTFIDKYGRHMILSEIARANRESLQVFRGLEEKNSFIEMVNNFISEIKQYNCSSADLRQMENLMMALAEQTTAQEKESKDAAAGTAPVTVLGEKETERHDTYNAAIDAPINAPFDAAIESKSYLQKKLGDLCLLYEEYEKKIEGKYTDSEDYIDLFIGKIAQSQLIAGNQIWIYGFDSFAPKALSIIGELMRYAEDVNVILTCDDDERARDSEVFQLEQIVTANLLRKAESLGVESQVSMIARAYLDEEKAPEIRYIEQELYALPAKPYRSPSAKTNSQLNSAEQAACDKTPAITLVTAANLYNEAESAAAYVLRLVRDEGYRYRDIRVICNDQEVRGAILKRTFREYGMELISDSEKGILQSPIVRCILAFFDILNERYRTDLIIGLHKTGLGELTADEIADLENYAIKYRIRRTMWKKPFAKGQFEYGEEGLDYINQLREKAVAPLIRFEEIFKAETNSGFIQGLYQFLYDDFGLPEKIQSFMDEQEAAGRMDLCEETAQIWDSVVGILDQMDEIIGAQNFDGKAFSLMLQTGLSQVKINILPPTDDGLLMGTMQRTRVGKIRALVVVGANEGVLPQGKGSDGLFGNDEKELFKMQGMELCKTDPIRIMEERLAIYRNLSRPSEKLWISFSNADAEGNTIKKSAIFSKLTDIFPDVTVEEDVLNRNSKLDLINDKTSGLRHLTEALQEAAENGALEKPWKEMLSWYQKNRKDTLDGIRYGIAFTNKQESLGKQMAGALYKKDADRTLTLSPSRVEKYARCPFSHLIQYGLKPEERRVFEIAPREIGDIYHECLKELTSSLTLPGVEVTAENSPWMTITRQECREIVENTAARETSRYREGLFTLGNEEKYRGGRIVDICEKVCWACVEQVRAGDILWSGFEIPFGRGKRIKPIRIQLDNQTAYIEGKIDRVDILRGEKVKIIDYKTGNETFSKTEAEEGYRLQLMLYLTACLGEKERKPAGVFYFNISEPMIDMSAKEIDGEKIESEVQKSFKLNGVLVDDPNVIESIAGDFSGYSDIIPVRNGKEGIVATGNGGLLSEGEFDSLIEAVGNKVHEICQDLADGNIDIAPMKTKQRSACTYCQYRGICRFDTMFEGCQYKIIR